MTRMPKRIMAWLDMQEGGLPEGEWVSDGDPLEARATVYIREDAILPPLGMRLLEYYEPHEVELWLTRPQPLLGGRTAIQVMAAGEDHLLHQVLDGIDGQTAT